MTAPARIAMDFAATANRGETERAIAEAFALKLASEAQILAALERAPFYVTAVIARVLDRLNRARG